MKEQFQIKDKFFDLIVKNPSRDGFKTFLKESCGELDMVLCQDLVQNKMRGSAS